MQGIEVNFDTNIGKQLSALGNTLTALAGETDENACRVQDDETDLNDLELDDEEVRHIVYECFVVYLQFVKFPSLL